MSNNNGNVIQFPTRNKNINYDQPVVEFGDDGDVFNPALPNDPQAIHMARDLLSTMEGCEDVIMSSEYAHGALIVLLDSNGNTYTHSLCTSPESRDRLLSLSMYMEVYNDVCKDAAENPDVFG